MLFVFGFTVINGYRTFYGLLAEKVEQHLDPNASLPTESFGSMVVRTLKREVSEVALVHPSGTDVIADQFDSRFEFDGAVFVVGVWRLGHGD